MKEENFDKLFDELFGDDLDEIEAELDELDGNESEDSEADEAVEASPSTADAADDDAEEDPNMVELRKAREARGIVPGGVDPQAGSFLDEVEEEKDFYEDTEVGGAHEASCPYCGEPVSIFLDPAGGSVQDYVEDCSVCCQPMSVSVRFTGGGQSEVSVNPAQ